MAKPARRARRARWRGGIGCTPCSVINREALFSVDASLLIALSEALFARRERDSNAENFSVSKPSCKASW